MRLADTDLLSPLLLVVRSNAVYWATASWFLLALSTCLCAGGGGMLHYQVLNRATV